MNPHPPVPETGALPIALLRENLERNAGRVRYPSGGLHACTEQGETLIGHARGLSAFPRNRGGVHAALQE